MGDEQAWSCPRLRAPNAFVSGVGGSASYKGNVEEDVALGKGAVGSDVWLVTAVLVRLS